MTHMIREFDICLRGGIVGDFFLQKETNSKENAKKTLNFFHEYGICYKF
jgi:hypothetical protein